MSRLTRDGTAEPVSRYQIRQGNFHFLVQLTTSRIGNLTRLILTLAICVTIHTYIHAGAPIAPRASFSIFWRCRFFRVFFVPLPFSLCMEYVVRSFLPDGVFLPCDHGLDFLHLVREDSIINQSIPFDTFNMPITYQK